MHLAGNIFKGVGAIQARAVEGQLVDHPRKP
jgi:hypothetical protein